MRRMDVARSAENGKDGGDSIWNRGGGVLRNLIAWGVFEPPLFLKWSVGGGGLRVFFDADTPFLRKIFGVLFWTAHPKFRPFPPFSHF